MKNKIFLAIAVCGLMISGCKQEKVTKIDSSSAAPDAAGSENTLANTPAAGSQDAKPEPPADGKYPVMTFENNEHDFGNIPDTDRVQTVFKFKNTGEADLLIRNAVGSCGCTVPEYPKTPIKPGESGEMKVSFSPTGKSGMQNKTVTITTNTASGTEKLTIKAAIQSSKNKNKPS